jgi:MYXO-CTERM domain-containing protein
MNRPALAAALLSLAATDALANGALPATIQVLAPPDAPATTIVTTNYGVITSTDDGGHWGWTCEHGLGQQGKAYQLTAPPASRLVGLATDGLVASDDLACGWSLLLDQQTVIPVDYFPDPNRGERVAVLGISRQQQRIYQVAELPGPRILYTAPAGQKLTTVEIARSDGQVLYATLIPDDPTASASLARSTDGGATWTVVTPAPPVPDLGILAIDQADPRKLYLRQVASDGDRLLVSEDAGQTLRMARAPLRVMSAFRQLPSGHLLVGWLDVDRGYVERSSDGGTTFTVLSPTFHANSLAERAGRVYAGLDHFADGYVLAASDDEGDTWRRVMGLGDVVISGCAPAECAGTCRGLIQRKVFTPAACGIPPDAGVVDAGVDAPVDASSVDAGEAKSEGGCSCRVGRESRSPAYFVLVLVLVLLLGRPRPCRTRERI